MYETAGSVTFEEGPLRPLHNFDPADVEQRECLALSHCDVTVIQIDGMGRFDDIIEVVLRDAADRILAILSSDVAAAVDARRKGCKIAAIGNVECA